LIITVCIRSTIRDSSIDKLIELDIRISKIKSLIMELISPNAIKYLTYIVLNKKENLKTTKPPPSSLRAPQKTGPASAHSHFQVNQYCHNLGITRNSLELRICSCGCRGRSCGAISGNLLRSYCFRVQAVTCCDLSRFLH
jgi:hypothetical protein